MTQTEIKGSANLLLLICLFTFLPMLILIFEHIINGKESALLKILNNI